MVYTTDQGYTVPPGLKNGSEKRIPLRRADNNEDSALGMKGDVAGENQIVLDDFRQRLGQVDEVIIAELPAERPTTLSVPPHAVR